MIIVRAPLRISIGGGGTDLPAYYSKYGGEWISAAINKYVYVIINKRFQKSFRISYSKTEEVDKIEQIEHPVVREALKLLKVNNGLEIVSIADIFSHTGLGSSGSFCVALLTGLYTYLKHNGNVELPSRKDIAEQACHIAIDILKEPSGKQDEYIAVYGGITSFSVDTKGEVTVEPLYPHKIKPEAVRDLESNLMLFYTGIRRNAREALRPQVKATLQRDPKTLESLHRTKEIGREIKEALIKNDFRRFGELLDLHWQEKIKRKGTTDPTINKWYEIAKKNGAVGGKIIGAGSGGFFLFYCEKGKDRLRKALEKEGLKEEPFHFDFEGVKVIADIV
jgi:D-glycero-alpha-D-manno-heptose-7-phosphate kinase